MAANMTAARTAPNSRCPADNMPPSKAARNAKTDSKATKSQFTLTQSIGIGLSLEKRVRQQPTAIDHCSAMVECGAKGEDHRIFFKCLSALTRGLVLEERPAILGEGAARSRVGV